MVARVDPLELQFRFLERLLFILKNPEEIDKAVLGRAALKIDGKPSNLTFPDKLNAFLSNGKKNDINCEKYQITFDADRINESCERIGNLLPHNFRTPNTFNLRERILIDGVFGSAKADVQKMYNHITDDLRDQMDLYLSSNTNTPSSDNAGFESAAAQFKAFNNLLLIFDQDVYPKLKKIGFSHAKILAPDPELLLSVKTELTNTLLAMRDEDKVKILLQSDIEKLDIPNEAKINLLITLNEHFKQIQGQTNNNNLFGKAHTDEQKKEIKALQKSFVLLLKSILPPEERLAGGVVEAMQTDKTSVINFTTKKLKLGQSTTQGQIDDLIKAAKKYRPLPE